jgi:hypothetical protein
MDGTPSSVALLLQDLSGKLYPGQRGLVNSQSSFSLTNRSEEAA